SPRYRAPNALLGGDSWHDCLPLPPLRPGYRASTLEFRAERLDGRFGN
ncbi:multidrug transporter, partial [Pseudomonas aeruginosa]|nr:multidrug transporter [Pseudomonas aeruginosa]